MRAYSTFTISEFPTERRDIIIAKLSLLPFEAFEEKEDLILAYIADEDIPLGIIPEIESIVGDAKITIEKVPQINWNAKWEASFKPVIIDQFCQVRASFHVPVANIKYDIIINPKMAFGTAHHETTYMMIKTMESIIIRGKRVFDYGCGTGILAILAHQMGAASVDAIDYDKEAADNAVENATFNGVNLDRIEQAELNQWSGNNYDVVLANINRHVLLDQVQGIKSIMAPQADLLLSGILIADKALVLDRYQAVGFSLISEMGRGDWVCLRLKLC